MAASYRVEETRMHFKLLIGASAALLVTVASVPASAQVYGRMLRDTPVAQFSKEDLQRHSAAVKEALEGGELDRPVSWSNDKTRSSGTITASAGKRDDCRTLHIETRYKAQSAKNEMHVCKVNGQWKAME
jgi:hypothetical protein